MITDNNTKANLMANVAITGASSGIGRMIAIEAANRGAQKLWLIDRNETGLTSLEESLSGVGDLRQRILDLSSREAIAKLADEWMREGPPGVLVNCAGIRGSTASLGDVSDDEWDDTISVNLTAVFLVTRAISNAMRHHKVAGVIVNIASTAAVIGFTNRVAYCASKAGVLGITRAAALDLAPYGIRVLAVSPGFQRSGLSDDLDDTVVTGTVPLGRRGEPAELATLIFDVARSSYVTGANLIVDGGMVVGRHLG
jgi:NAD(P)-dependent dehydrogenase (short-subunit alcohol dehydrogenase family)